MRFLIFLICLGYFPLTAVTYSLEDLVTTALDENPDILKTYEDIRQAYGFYKQQSGQFDWNWDSSFGRQHLSQVSTIGQYNTGNPPVLYTNQTTLNASLQHLFRNGLQITPSIAWQKIRDNYTNITAPSQGTVQLAVTVPFLRGLGEISTAGEEIAARMDWRATFLTTSHEISRIVSTIAKSYWQYIFTEQTLKILADALKRSEQIADDIDKLIAGNENAGTDRYQPRADVAAKKSALLAQQIQLDTVKRELLRVMRIPQAIEEEIAFDIRDFPLPTIEEVRAAPPFLTLRTIAAENRMDIAGKRENLAGRNILVLQARNHLLPTLNLQMQANSQGFIQNPLPKKNITPGPPAFPVVPAPDQHLKTGFFNSFKEGVVQTDYSGTVTFNYPLCNLQSKGILIQRQAEYDRVFFELISLYDGMDKDVAASIYALKLQAERHEELRIQTENYKQASDAETRKLLLGYSSVINVIQLENRYLDSLLSLTQQASDYTNALIDLRFQMGLILHPYEGNVLMSDYDLYGLPWIRDANDCSCPNLADKLRPATQPCVSKKW